MTDTTQTLQQRRAASAWQQIAEIDGKDDKTRKEYGSLVRGLPAMIVGNGIGPTLAFLQAKAGGDQNKPHAFAYRHLAAWISGEMTVNGDLLPWLVQQSSVEYRLVTAEALAYLQWLKRFAEAKLEREE